ncbi:hypothetical protein CYD53_101597 [Bosea psychrotolerans]|uniref:Uncharacterized protein n=2 Tax=Bosea psychrotolerans TaxID=1871628 RepID=A0A2S4MQU6_9HYPH|nr:hypothetical protein CYD53_101597 [Bosea psychrotolerans]
MTHSFSQQLKPSPIRSDRSMAPGLSFNAFSSREPVSTSPGNALADPGGTPAAPNPPLEAPPLMPTEIPPAPPVESPPDEAPAGIPTEPPPELPPNGPPEGPPATPIDLPPGRDPRQPQE